MITKTLLIRVNPTSNGFSVVLTNHNIAGAENRQEVNASDFADVQNKVANFLTTVQETSEAQDAQAAEKKAAESPTAAPAKPEAPAEPAAQ